MFNVGLFWIAAFLACLVFWSELFWLLGWV
jgi:hypothetical protein